MENSEKRRHLLDSLQKKLDEVSCSSIHLSIFSSSDYLSFMSVNALVFHVCQVFLELHIDFYHLST